MTPPARQPHTPAAPLSDVFVVTDSFAHFGSPDSLHGAPLVVVPTHIQIAGRVYREGVDLHAEEALRLIGHLTPTASGQRPAISVTPPSTSEYMDALRRLRGHARAIVIITASREMFSSWQHAKQAAQQLTGLCPMAVIDSATLSAAQGLLVRYALREVSRHTTLDSLVRAIRGAVERSYAVYFAESMEPLLDSGIVPPAHAILGAMMNVKPVLTIEHGRLTAMEKVRTRAQAVERLVEFAIEFTSIADAMIVQSKPGLAENARMLQDRLAVEFPDRAFSTMLYGPSLAALIGAEATGLVVLENDPLEDDDDGDW